MPFPETSATDADVQEEHDACESFLCQMEEIKGGASRTSPSMSLGKVWASASVRRLQQRPAVIADVREQFLKKLSAKQEECSMHSVSVTTLRRNLAGSKEVTTMDGKVTTMQSMFDGASAFNQAIDDWDTSNASAMDNMFYYVSAFNQAIGGWDNSDVTAMESMFDSASNFNQTIGAWVELAKPDKCQEQLIVFAFLMSEEYKRKLAHGTAIHKIHLGRAAELINHHLLVHGVVQFHERELGAKSFQDELGANSFQHNQSKTTLLNEMEKESRRAWREQIGAGELSRGSDTVFAEIVDDQRVAQLRAFDYECVSSMPMIWSAWKKKVKQDADEKQKNEVEQELAAEKAKAKKAFEEGAVKGKEGKSVAEDTEVSEVNTNIESDENLASSFAKQTAGESAQKEAAEGAEKVEEEKEKDDAEHKTGSEVESTRLQEDAKAKNDDITIKDLATGFPKLEATRLDECWSVGDDGIKEIASHCKDLREFTRISIEEKSGYTADPSELMRSMEAAEVYKNLFIDEVVEFLKEDFELTSMKNMKFSELKAEARDLGAKEEEIQACEEEYTSNYRDALVRVVLTKRKDGELEAGGIDEIWSTDRLEDGRVAAWRSSRLGGSMAEVRAELEADDIDENSFIAWTFVARLKNGPFVACNNADRGSEMANVKVKAEIKATCIPNHTMFAKMCDGRTLPLLGLTPESCVDDTFCLLDEYVRRGLYRIAFAGRPVINGTLKEYGIQKASTIDVIPRLRGGMPQFPREDEKYLGSTSNLGLVHGVELDLVRGRVPVVHQHTPEAKIPEPVVPAPLEAIHTLHGVSVAIVCDNVLAVKLDASSIFDARSAVMLQVALSSFEEVDELVDYLPEDRAIYDSCLRCGFAASSDFTYVTLRENGLKAVGVSGRESSLFALVLELMRENEDTCNELLSHLRELDLADAFGQILKFCATAQPRADQASSFTLVVESKSRKRGNKIHSCPANISSEVSSSCASTEPAPEDFPEELPSQEYLPGEAPPVRKPQPPPPSAPKKAVPPPRHGIAMMPNGCIPASRPPPPPPPRKGIDLVDVTPRVRKVLPWHFDDDDPPFPATRQKSGAAPRVQPWLVDETTPPSRNTTQVPDVSRVERPVELQISNPAALPYALRVASSEKRKLQQLNGHGGVQQVEEVCHIQKVSSWQIDEEPPQNGCDARHRALAGRALADRNRVQTQTLAPTEAVRLQNFPAEPQTQTRIDFELKNEFALKLGERTPSFSDTASSVSREADSIWAPWRKHARDQEVEFRRTPEAVAPTETISQEVETVWASWKKDFKAVNSGSDAWAGWTKKADVWESSSWEKGWNRSQWAKFFWNEGCKMKMKTLRQTTDDELTSMAAYLTEDFFPQLRQVTPTLPIWFDELNLGGNKLRDSGVKAVLTALIEHGVQLRSVKMHKNLIGPSGADAVARLINESPLPPAEVHLSHNLLGPPDVRTLILAAAGREEYPLRDSRDVRPLWLRIERQQGKQWDSCHDHETRWQRTQEMITFAEKRVIQIRQSMGCLPDPCPVDLGYMLCLPEFNCRCSSRYCLKTHEYGPIIQLPYMWEQGATYAHREYAKERQSGFDTGAAVEVYHAVSEPKWMPSFKSNDILWKASKAARSNSLEKYELEVVYESATAMVLNKGPGWVCKWNAFSKLSSTMKGFPRQQHLDKRSWQELVSSKSWEFFDSYLARRFEDQMACDWWDWQRSPQVGREPAAGAGCVHRLDKDTSGCIVRGKTQASFEELKTQVQRVGFQKHYLCLVHSHVPNGGQRHEITAKIASPVQGGPIQAYIDEESGEWSETRVWCLAHLRSPVGDYSLCEVRILTGRTHQIRVHLEHMGWPLVSDEKYNSLYAWKDSLWCPRIFLHSYTVTFYDASVSDYVDVRSSVPQDLRDALLHLTLERDFTNGHMQKVLSDSWDGHMPDTVLHERQEKDQAHSSWEGYNSTKRDWQSYSDWDKYKPSNKERDWPNHKNADWDNGKSKDCDDEKSKGWDDWDNGKNRHWDGSTTGDWTKYEEGAREASTDGTRAHDLEALEAALQSVLQKLLRGGSVEIAKLSKNLDVRVKLRKLQCGGPDAESDAARLEVFLNSRQHMIKSANGIAEVVSENLNSV